MRTHDIEGNTDTEAYYNEAGSEGDNQENNYISYIIYLLVMV